MSGHTSMKEQLSVDPHNLVTRLLNIVLVQLQTQLAQSGFPPSFKLMDSGLAAFEIHNVISVQSIYYSVMDPLISISQRASQFLEELLRLCQQRSGANCYDISRMVTDSKLETDLAQVQKEIDAYQQKCILMSSIGMSTGESVPSTKQIICITGQYHVEVFGSRDWIRFYRILSQKLTRRANGALLHTAHPAIRGARVRNVFRCSKIVTEAMSSQSSSFKPLEQLCKLLRQQNIVLLDRVFDIFKNDMLVSEDELNKLLSKWVEESQRLKEEGKNHQRRSNLALIAKRGSRRTSTIALFKGFRMERKSQLQNKQVRQSRNKGILVPEDLDTLNERSLKQVSLKKAVLNRPPLQVLSENLREKRLDWRDKSQKTQLSGAASESVSESLHNNKVPETEQRNTSTIRIKALRTSKLSQLENSQPLGLSLHQARNTSEFEESFQPVECILKKNASDVADSSFYSSARQNLLKNNSSSSHSSLKSKVVVAPLSKSKTTSSWNRKVLAIKQPALSEVRRVVLAPIDFSSMFSRVVQEAKASCDKNISSKSKRPVKWQGRTSPLYEVYDCRQHKLMH